MKIVDAEPMLGNERLHRLLPVRGARWSSADLVRDLSV